MLQKLYFSEELKRYIIESLTKWRKAYVVSKNMAVCDWGTIFEIEPAIEPIFELPIGTELTLVYDGNKKYFVNSETGEKMF